MTILDELEKLLAEATKGKWSVTDEHEILSVETRTDPIDGTTYEERTLIVQGECSQNWGYIEWFNLADAALIVAAINALPGLLAICNAAKTALGHLDDPTGGDEINDMRRASDVLRAALKGT
jgi:hypothetical protein